MVFQKIARVFYWIAFLNSFPVVADLAAGTGDSIPSVTALESFSDNIMEAAECRFHRLERRRGALQDEPSG